MSPKEGALRVSGLAGQVRVQEDLAINEVLEVALEEAYELSSGTLTYAEMAALDHPYATRHAGVRVPGDPAIINRHGDDGFAEAWRIDPATEDGADPIARLVNDYTVDGFNVADALENGTGIMIARPIRERIEERIQPILEAAVEKAAQRIKT
jgi:hypothetical protein